MAVGLRWHYDVTGAEPIIRDIRVYNVGALEKGTAMCAGPVATAENTGCAIVADGNVLSNIIGVLQEDLTAAEALGVVATGVDKYAKLIINPMAIWLGKYSTHADDDEVNTSADSTGKVITCTMVTDHERGWAYVTDTGSSTGGFGNLFQIGASGTTATITAATSYDDYLLGNTTSDTFIVLPAPWYVDVAGGGVELSEATGINAMQIAGYETTAAAGSGLIIENYIQSSRRSLEPLVCAQHSGKNYKDEDPDFFGDLYFCEHLLCAGAPVNNRVIT